MKKRMYIPLLVLLLFFTKITLLSNVNITSASPSLIKIVALGDSITYGVGDPLKKGYIIRLKDKLEHYFGTRIYIRNFGIPKYKTNQTLDQLKDKKIIKAVEKSDYIILYIGTNDFRKSADHHFEQIDPVNMKVGKEIYSKNLRQILTNIRQHSSVPIFVLGLYDPYTDYENNEQIHQLITSWNHEIKEVVSNYPHAVFVQTLDLFQGVPKDVNFSDSLHPNPNGYDKISTRLFENIILNTENSKGKSS